MMDNAAEHYRKEKIDLYIETVKGNRFYFDRPVFDVEEIAHATSMQCRYTGHSSQFYSVAEHSVVVARLMLRLDLGDPFEGLMHDATEAYLSDIAAPWKVLLPDYKKLETELETKIRREFSLPPKITDGCKRADWLALFVEAHQLIPSKAADWIAPPGIKEQSAEILAGDWWPGLDCMAPAEAKKSFLRMFNAIR